MILFDLDGTLWDSSENVALSWNEVLQEEAPELAMLKAEDIQRVMGKTMDQIAETLFTGKYAERRKELLDKCSRHEVQRLATLGGVLCPNVRDTLEYLKREGYRMGIVSNCQTGYILSFFRSMDMGKYFCDFEEWGRTGKSKSDNIRAVMERNLAEEAYYIGDTQGDCNAADEAGIPFIHASYGFGKTEHSVLELDILSDLIPFLLGKIKT